MSNHDQNTNSKGVNFQSKQASNNLTVSNQQIDEICKNIEDRIKDNEVQESHMH